MRFLPYYFLFVAIAFAALMSTCGISRLRNDLGAGRLLTKLEELGLPPSAEPILSGKAVGNFHNTGNEIDILGYRIVRTKSPEDLRDFFREYRHQPPDFLQKSESTVDRPWIDVASLEDLSMRDPVRLRDLAPEIRRLHGRDLFAVYSVVRYSEGTFDWRGM